MTAAIFAVVAAVYILTSYWCHKAGYPEFSPMLIGLSIASGVASLVSLILF